MGCVDYQLSSVDVGEGEHDLANATTASIVVSFVLRFAHIFIKQGLCGSSSGGEACESATSKLRPEISNFVECRNPRATIIQGR